MGRRPCETRRFLCRGRRPRRPVFMEIYVGTASLRSTPRYEVLTSRFVQPSPDGRGQGEGYDEIISPYKFGNWINTFFENNQYWYFVVYEKRGRCGTDPYNIFMPRHTDILIQPSPDGRGQGEGEMKNAAIL